MKIRFTRTQAEEIAHKISVMEQDGVVEGSMADSYGFTDETLAALSAKFPTVLKASSIVVDLTPAEAIAVEGELENSFDIASENSAERYDAYYVAYYRFRDGINRIKAARKKDGFTA